MFFCQPCLTCSISVKERTPSHATTKSTSLLLAKINRTQRRALVSHCMYSVMTKGTSQAEPTLECSVQNQARSLSHYRGISKLVSQSIENSL